MSEGELRDCQGCFIWGLVGVLFWCVILAKCSSS